ncbi:MAG: outer membrane beta-barrel protein, partial [Terriglobales bacterium]
MKQAMKACLVIFTMLLMAGNAAAQSAATAQLHVTVKDPKGAVVKNATVTARDDARNTERVATNNVEGEYQILAIPPGQYTITVQAPGFAKTVARDVALTIGQTAEVPVTLQIASVESVIDVSTEAELVETQRTASTTTIDQQRIDNLPINGRNYINFTLTDSKLARDNTPNIPIAPTSGLNFGGQRARANLVNVDGADAVDNSTNGIRSTVSQEAVQEFQIITNNYAAEYGRASGGVVNIITRSGSNAFHGSAFGYLRNRNIQAVNHFSNVPDPAYTRVQAGLAAGGPIKKDRTFYYFSYETTRRRETGFSNIGANNFDLVPFNAAPLAPLMGGLNLGTVLLTNTQIAFVNKLAGFVPASPASYSPALAGYLGAAGAASGVALNGVLPTPAILAVMAGNGIPTGGCTAT